MTYFKSDVPMDNKGWLLGSLWFVEFLFFVLYAPTRCAASAGFPYSEADQRWFAVEKFPQLKFIAFAKALIAQLEAGDDATFQAMQKFEGRDSNATNVTLYQLEGRSARLTVGTTTRKYSTIAESSLEEFVEISEGLGCALVNKLEERRQANVCAPAAK
ncbi:MAG: hypothetical protein ACI841_002659 [Planctomycetota bacterium]